MIEGLGGISAPLPLRGADMERAAPAAPAKGAGTADFAEALKEAAGKAVQTVQESEKVAIDALQGKADIQQVVDSVMAAERTLSAALAIRNKLVSAWQEISRMQI